MNKLFNKKIGRKKNEEMELGEEEMRTGAKMEPEKVTSKASYNVSTNDVVCGEEDACMAPPHTPLPVYPESTTAGGAEAISGDSGKSVLNPSIVTAVSSTLVLVLLAWNLLFRRKQRKQRSMWKKDSQKILTRVEDVVLQLEERDEEVERLQQQLKTQGEDDAKEKERITQESKVALDAKDAQCEMLKATIGDLKRLQKEADSRLGKAAGEIKGYVEGQQDHECQLLEQKLQASQLSNLLAERELRIEELLQTCQAQTHRIQELQQRMKADALKAEKFVEDLTSERDDRFAILQQENDAIKTTVMGMLKTTQARYDEDKVLLKKEMRRRDEKIRSLQEELWQSNSLLKRLKQDHGVQSKLSESVRNLIDDIPVASKSGKDRRSSTYDAAETILEGNTECEELKELQTMLQK